MLAGLYRQVASDKAFARSWGYTFHILRKDGHVVTYSGSHSPMGYHVTEVCIYLVKPIDLIEYINLEKMAQYGHTDKTPVRVCFPNLKFS